MEIYSKVKYPQMRQILIFALEDLCNVKLQKKEWVSNNFKHSFWDNLYYCYETLEDLDLHVDPESEIGTILVNREECDILQPVYKTTDDLYEAVGEKQPDAAYYNCPLWDKVVEAAQAAFDVFQKNEEKARAINPRAWAGEDDWHLIP